MSKSAKKSATKICHLLFSNPFSLFDSNLSVEVAPAAVTTKPLKKGKREAEEAVEQVPEAKEAALKQVIAKKKAETKTKKSKKVETSSDDDSSDSEEEVEVKPVAKKIVKKPVESTSEEDSSYDEETTVVPAKIAKSVPKVKADSSSSDEHSDSEDDEPKSKVPVKKVHAALVAKNGSIAAKKKDETSDDSDSKSEDESDGEYDRSTGQSRGFGYVTFATLELSALESEHCLGNRILEVKVATPKEEMRAPASKKATRIFVARILPSIMEATFKSYFEKYDEITDLYMPKDPSTKGHRGIGFITFANAESVDDLMAETHELGGSTVVVDRATPKASNDI